MRTRVFAIAALVGASALAANAQTPQPPRPQQEKPTASGQMPQTGNQNAQTVTVTGCLKAEKDVPGRRPNVAERAGITEDYILTNVKMSPGSSTSAIGLASMLEVEGIAEGELQKHLNHQIEVTGRLTTGAMQGNRGTAPETNPGGERREGTPQAAAHADLPEIQATGIKMIAATCPAQ
jgi:hypothetical protein